RNLPEVRRLLFAGKPAAAEALAEQTMIAVPKRLPPYQPLGDLRLRIPGHERFDGYLRGLDLDSAIVRLTYRAGDAVYHREVFASAVDQVLVMRLVCDRPGRIAFSAALGRDQDGRVEVVAPDRLTLRGQAIARDDRHRDERKVGVRFACELRVLPEGGRVQAVGDHLEVRDADAATLLLAAATNFRSQDPTAACEHALTAAAGRPYDRLRAAHTADHRALFRRVELDLNGPHGDGVPGPDDRPTDD